MNTTLNIAMIVAFTFLGGWMFVRYFHTRDKLIVQDKTWNFMRISFGMIEVLAVASLLAGGNSFGFVRTFFIPEKVRYKLQHTRCC